MEVMIVVAIIAVMTMAALPNLLSGQHAQRIKAATNDTMDIFQFAKVRAANDFNAYGVEVLPNEGTGIIRVFEGSGPACSGITWGAPLKSLLFSEDFGPAEGDIRLLQVTPAGVSRLCLTPNGRIVDAKTNKPVPSADPKYGAGEFILTLQGHLDDLPVGLTHHVIVSYSGKARFTFGDEPESAEGEGGT
jgi:type II secretory pathway pseudopilin PulG